MGSREHNQWATTGVGLLPDRPKTPDVDDEQTTMSHPFSLPREGAIEDSTRVLAREYSTYGLQVFKIEQIRKVAY